MLLVSPVIGEGSHPQIGVKTWERHEVDWYEDNMGSMPLSESVPGKEDLFGDRYVFKLDLFDAIYVSSSVDKEDCRACGQGQ